MGSKRTVPVYQKQHNTVRIKTLKEFKSAFSVWPDAPNDFVFAFLISRFRWVLRLMVKSLCRLCTGLRSTSELWNLQEHLHTTVLVKVDSSLQMQFKATFAQSNNDFYSLKRMYLYNQLKLLFPGRFLHWYCMKSCTSFSCIYLRFFPPLLVVIVSTSSY